MVDLFCGGCNVGINAPTSKVLFNDTNSWLTGLFEVLKDQEEQEVFRQTGDLIERFGLSKSWEHGYGYYHCENSGDGLASFNREPFLKLRKAFNGKKERDGEYYLMRYVLIVYSFNNQIRFNRKGEFNLPVGKRDFNLRMQQKLQAFMRRLKCGDYRFSNQDFLKIRPEDFGE